MVELKDGPCKGSFMVKRAPVYLRAVINEKGETDLLDQIEDTPGQKEKVHVYKMEGNPGTVHLFARGKNGKSLSGWYAMAIYNHMPEVDGEQLRDNPKWQEWATNQLKVEVQP